MITVVCDDPKKGEVQYEISPLILTPTNLQMFWKKSSKYTTLFNEEIRNDFGKFLSVFVSTTGAGEIQGKGLFWKVDTKDEEMLGVFYVTDITLDTDAQVHFSFFDGRTKGRIPLARAMLKYLFEHYNFNRVSVQIPVFVIPATFKFIEGLGFLKEGKKRRAIKFDNKFFDIVLYGILKDEVLNGN